MSREHGPIGLAIEWSPRGVVAYDASTRSTKVGDELSSLGLSGREAVLALSRRGVFIRTTRVPNATPDEVRGILTMQAAELFPVPPVDLAWDFLLTDDVNEEGRLAVLAAVPSAELRRTLEAAANAGVKVRAAIPLALGSILIAQELGVAEAAVVERSDDGPAVDVVSHGSLRASRATPPSVPLEMEVSRALGLAGLDAAAVIAAGGADIPDAARQTDRTALMALADTALDRLKLRIELPEAVAARAAAANRRSVRSALGAVVVAALLAGVVGMDWSDAVSAVNKTKSQSASRLQKVKTASTKAGTELSRTVAMKDALDLAFSPAQKISDVLAVTTTSVPTGTWLKTLTVERGKPISLRGTAKEENLVADLVRKLDQNPEKRFRDVQITNASNTLVNKVPVTEFVLTAFPVGNLPFLARVGATSAR